MSQFAVILAAAGMSHRFRDPHYNKVVVPLAGRPLWALRIGMRFRVGEERLHQLLDTAMS